MSLLRIIVLCVACACATEAYNVLIVFPMPSRSHGILGEGIARLLVKAGHEVTYITPFPIKNANPKLTQIDVSDNLKLMDGVSIQAILDKEQNVADPRNFFNMTLGMHKTTLLNENVQKLCKDTKQNFDVVIVEWMFSELPSGFAAVFDAPYIWMSSIEPHSFILSLVDEDLNPAYNPGMLTSSVPPFNFFERVRELGLHLGVKLLKDLYFEGVEAKEYEELFGPLIKIRGKEIPRFVDLKYNASLVLGNSHVSIGQPTRLPQNYKDIRGYHINPELKPLPKDLQELLDNAKNGLIYFSMGSNLRSKDLPESIKKNLVKIFGQLKQTVLWKFEQNFPDLPSNVHIVQWAPQPSILAHPNCILFITHGGGLSTTEAVYYGKPTIGIPVFGDQFTNVDRAVKKGISKKVDLSYNMAEDLKVAIEDIIRDPSYAAKSKEVSWIFHHRPASPGAELVHWVEHVAHTRGAPHLRSPALHVPLYQKLYIDLAAVLLTILYLIFYVIRATFRRLTSKRTKKDDKKKNEKKKKN